MKQSMDVTIIKSLVKDETIKSLLIDYCKERYCNISTDNANITVENRQSVGEFNKGNQYLVVVHYSSYTPCNLSITVSTKEKNLIDNAVLHKPSTFPLESIIDSLIKGYLIRELNRINHQLNILEGEQ